MKIKEEQLKKIQEQQDSLQKLISNVGILETQKHGLLHELAEVNKGVEEYKKELEKEYGRININLEDGSYTIIPEEELEEANV
jgi:septal ring factor EnvC (AmiA/AmiB activator)